jgi:hypothetical protein
MADELGIVLPPGVTRESPGEQLTRGVVVNETDLPDDLVTASVQTYFEENASLAGISGSTHLQSWSGGDGSLLARRRYRVPTNVIDEICLARDLAERDDDVATAIGMLSAIAFGSGMRNTHADELTVEAFDKVAGHANLDAIWMELYREWLIAGSITTSTPFVREDFDMFPAGRERQSSRSLAAPLVGVLPAEQIRVLGNDMYRTGVLAYKPMLGSQERWLEEFFDPATTPARKAEMRREDPVLTTMLIERRVIATEPPVFSLEIADAAMGNTVYILNPRMVGRSTMAKGAWTYPRPPMARNFPLLEAKRLLNIMDFALLQGGANFLVVAKKGTDQRPAQGPEVENLREVIKRASTTGVIIGDHRLSIEVITPDLSSLLDTEKRRLLGRKLANALLRVPEQDDDAGGEGMKARVELISRVMEADRLALRRHVERYVYDETAKRNPGMFPRGAASIWFPKIVLQGTNYFTDYVLKLRDRGDIPRRFAIEAAGFDYEASVQYRKREKADGDDRVLTPPPVPFTNPTAGPQDNNAGRPPGSSSNNGAPGANRTQPAASGRPAQTISRNQGETVRAMYDEEHGYFRSGELTYAILEQYAEDRAIGRLTSFEQSAVAKIAAGEYAVLSEGPLTVVPVNADHELERVRAVRLAPGLSMLLGYRPDDEAILARALVFRAPEFNHLDAEETALRWGFQAGAPPTVEERAAEAPAAPAPQLIVMQGGGGTRKTVERDEHGNIIGLREEPIEPTEVS